jgi:hypothetical protein
MRDVSSSTTAPSLVHAAVRFLRIVFGPRSRSELYFHSPCFDGIASAVLTLDFLEQRLGWSSVQLFAVNYSSKGSWLSKHLAENAAVVDFLYHPQADFWADHHGTTFLDGMRLPTERQQDPMVMFDPSAPSCALLIQQRLDQQYRYRNHRYDSLVTWATKIDSARYDSVDEAIFGDAAALRLNTALQVADREFTVWLVRALRRQTVEQVASSPKVEEWFQKGRGLVRDGLDSFRSSAAMDDDGIVTFDLARNGSVTNRYAPYYFYRDARYSVGIVRSGDKATITAMRNPWREFESINLGRLFEPHGGGGHQRVASVVVEGPTSHEEARRIRDDIVDAIRRSLHYQPAAAGAL